MLISCKTQWILLYRCILAPVVLLIYDCFKKKKKKVFSVWSIYIIINIDNYSVHMLALYLIILLLLVYSVFVCVCMCVCGVQPCIHTIHAHSFTAYFVTVLFMGYDSCSMPCGWSWLWERERERERRRRRSLTVEFIIIVNSYNNNILYIIYFSWS